MTAAAGREGRPTGPQPFATSYVIGTTLILVVAFVVYDLVRGRELEPVGYVIFALLYPFAIIGGRRIYIWRMRRRADRNR